MKQVLQDYLKKMNIFVSNEDQDTILSYARHLQKTEGFTDEKAIEEAVYQSAHGSLSARVTPCMSMRVDIYQDGRIVLNGGLTTGNTSQERVVRQVNDYEDVYEALMDGFEDLLTRTVAKLPDKPKPQ